MRKTNISASILIMMIASLFISSCQKDMGPPSLSFIEGEGFLSQDTILMVGDTVIVGLRLDWNGVNKLQTLEVYAGEFLLQSYSLTDMDSGEYSFKLMKSPSDEEIWKFTLIDKKGNRGSLSIKLEKDPASIYGSVLSYNNLILGAQSNLITPGFIGFSNLSVFSLDVAFENQELIDMVYYFDEIDMISIASPSANIDSSIFSGSSALDNWTVKNTTGFLKTDLTSEEFEAIFHDGIILNEYSEEKAKRKAKNLEIGDVYVFKTESGLMGAFSVINIEGTDDGEITLNIKLQGE